MKKIIITKILIIIVGGSLVWNIMTFLYTWIDGYYHLAADSSKEPSGIEIWRYINYFSRWGHYPSLDFPLVVGINEYIRPFLYSSLNVTVSIFFILFPISVLMNLWIGKIVEVQCRYVRILSFSTFIGIISVPLLMIIDASSLIMGHRFIGIMFLYLILLAVIFSIIAWSVASFLLWRYNRKNKL